LYGYVGDEYFTTPVDDEILKYGAGTAQLLSDLRRAMNENGGLSKNAKEVAARYFKSLVVGNYGDNMNEGTKSDAEMIQEGIDAYRAKKTK